MCIYRYFVAVCIPRNRMGGAESVFHYAAGGTIGLASSVLAFSYYSSVREARKDRKRAKNFDVDTHAETLYYTGCAALLLLTIAYLGSGAGVGIVTRTDGGVIYLFKHLLTALAVAFVHYLVARTMVIARGTAQVGALLAGVAAVFVGAGGTIDPPGGANLFFMLASLLLWLIAFAILATGARRGVLNLVFWVYILLKVATLLVFVLGDESFRVISLWALELIAIGILDFVSIVALVFWMLYRELAPCDQQQQPAVEHATSRSEYHHHQSTRSTRTVSAKGFQ